MFCCSSIGITGATILLRTFSISASFFSGSSSLMLIGFISKFSLLKSSSLVSGVQLTGIVMLVPGILFSRTLVLMGSVYSAQAMYSNISLANIVNASCISLI